MTQAGEDSATSGDDTTIGGDTAAGDGTTARGDTAAGDATTARGDTATGDDAAVSAGSAGDGDTAVGGDTAVVIPAVNEGERIAATVAAAAGLPGVDLVVVVDDGSTDQTGRVARAAGARVVRHSRNRGKAAAMETGAEAVRLLDEDRPPRHLLFLDADLGETARAAAPLVEPVRAGRADMTIAVFSTRVKLGGHGLVVRLSKDGIRRATGFEPAQPLNGQRCLTRAAFEAARPLAQGFGVETALTIDLLRKGFRIAEVEVEMSHRATGNDWRAQVHRARQLRDVARALATREPLVVESLDKIRPKR